jgi:hypothetical protein
VYLEGVRIRFLPDSLGFGCFIEVDSGSGFLGVFVLIPVECRNRIENFC